jgi:hypothetical protein
LFGDKLYAGQLPTQLGIIGSQEVSNFIGLLDDYPNAAAAYSLRKLRITYTGNAIEVRRTNNDVADIGFTSTNELDTAALLAFTGTGALDNGFVTKWYDQSGNGYNATQTTAVNQPKIVSGGSLITENGKPSIEFDGSNFYLDLNLTQAKNLTNSAYKAIAIVSKDSGITGVRNRTFFIGLNTQTRITFINETSNNFDGAMNGYAGRVQITFNTQQQYLAFAEDLNGVQSFYLNSTTSGSNNNGGTTNDANNAFLGYTTVDYFNGTMQEVIMYPSDQSSNRTGIESNINNFYSIY